jgi:hypothetical protein
MANLDLRVTFLPIGHETPASNNGTAPRARRRHLGEVTLMVDTGMKYRETYGERARRAGGSSFG